MHATLSQNVLSTDMNTLMASCPKAYFVWFCLLPGSPAPAAEKRNDTAEKFLNFFLVKKFLCAREKHGL